MFKSMCCFYGRLGLAFQHPHGRSQPYVIPDPRELITSLLVTATTVLTWYTDKYESKISIYIYFFS